MLSAPPPDPASALLRGYRPGGAARDELCDPRGGVRGHWRPLLDHLESLGAGEIARRWAKAQRLIHEHGVSYNVHGDPKGSDRPWPLSPLPLLLPEEEWQALEAGLTQRARLHERILDDLYGAQRLVRDGLLPAELVFANPGFLRPCQGLPVVDGRWLPLYAADLVRRADGRFAVLSDRTQVPTGAGYALENRIIVSRTLPEAFRACNVERHAPFFRGLRDSLRRLAPRREDDPLVVLLSAGPIDHTYFEQAFLAQYLGYPLVHGGDLTVRGGCVYLKTLGGLQRVHVILRRVDDELCDPLELRPDALTGIPGLVQAVRDRSVAVANPLGSGAAGAPAWLPYLPRLCRSLLGEPLRLETVETHWCGDPEALALVLDRLPALVVKPAFVRGDVHPIFAGQLDAAGLADLRARIEARPERFVAQEHVTPATTPALAADRLEPRSWVLRTFLAATADGHAVLPGGLTRFAPAADGLEASIHRGGRSKDTWVLARRPVAEVSLLPSPTAAVPLSRGGGDLPSRVADNLLWLGRYAERAEGLARLARVIALRLLDQGADASGAIEIPPLLRAFHVSSHLEEPTLSAAGPQVLASWKGALIAALDGAEAPGSLRATLRSLNRVARESRDRISSDSWRVLMSVDSELGQGQGRGEAAALRLDALLPILDGLVVLLSALGGLVGDSMTRGQAWRFLDIGRRIERASQVVPLLGCTFGEAREGEGPLVEAVLEAADSGMTFRRRYLGRLEVAPALDLLLTDETNPRAAIFQVAILSEHVAALPRDERTAMMSPVERLVLGLAHDLRFADAHALATPGSDGARAGLVALLERLGEDLPAVADALGASYLSHATLSRQLGGGGR